MTLTFSVVGEWVARRLNHPNVSLDAAVFAGAGLLGLPRLVPIAGSLIWFWASLSESARPWSPFRHRASAFVWVAAVAADAGDVTERESCRLASFS